MQAPFREQPPVEGSRDAGHEYHRQLVIGRLQLGGVNSGSWEKTVLKSLAGRSLRSTESSGGGDPLLLHNLPMLVTMSSTMPSAFVPEEHPRSATVNVSGLSDW